MSETLADRRIAAEETLAGLIVQRNEAMLAGKEFDHDKVAATEAEIEALTDAEVKAVRLQREEVAAEFRSRRLALCDGMIGAAGRRAGAIDDAEAAARSLVKALKSALDETVTIGSFAAQLGKKPLAGLEQTVLELSQCIGVQFRKLGHPNVFGLITFRHGAFPTDGVWLEASRKNAAAEISQIVRTEKGLD